jgi:lipopolysaccharide heptosyltransferase II
MEPDPSILVIRRRYLGDIVLLGSLFRNLRLHWPRARIVALVEPAYAGILALNPDVDQVVSPPDRALRWPGFVRRLRALSLTHVLDIDNTEKTALIARLCGARKRVVLHHGNRRLRLPALYTDRVYHPSEEHETQSITEYYLKALEPVGVPLATREIRLVPREIQVAEWRRFIGSQGRTLLVHPGSRSPARLWPAENFAAVCDRVQDEIGAQVVLVGGKAEAGTIAAIRAAMRTHALKPVVSPSLDELAALARACTALLCHDSGPMHVAAAVGTPVVALYGSQNPKLFHPAGEGHRLLLPSLPCSPCLAPDTCVPGDSYRTVCVRRHTPDSVFSAVESVLRSAA